eukprot:GAFH01001628.1.p1 GENE.GAFH01001628.1~~GAFH01001628.1.p1  ORF type:complete len:491 (+),score=96.45 GAFH01001628.1:30-1475(+)
MTDAPLMRSISGLRGIAGKTINEAVVRAHVGAFLKVLLTPPVPTGEKLIILGRDSRTSGPEYSAYAVEVIRSFGFNCMEIGIVPTPTVQLFVTHFRAWGGIIITSSHNPIPWNGLKFVDSDGIFLTPDKCARLYDLASLHGSTPQWEPLPEAAWGRCTPLANAWRIHNDCLLHLPFLPLEAIRAMHLRVCIDPVNGAGGPPLKALLEELGCEVISINLEPNGLFAHTPEPIPENLGDLSKAVLANRGEMGIAVDPDADRCVLLDEHGHPLGEEYTLALAVEYMLGVRGARGPVCKNMSSSRVTDDIAKKYGCEMHTTAVGEINVAQEMGRCHAVIGGEGNGGVMLPDLHIGRDSLVATALVLSLLSHARLTAPGMTISQLKASLPQYDIVKDKFSLGAVPPARVDAFLAELEAQWRASGSRITTGDGLRIDNDVEGWWVHLRRSNTEPIVRVIGEAPTRALAEHWCRHFRELFERALFPAK